MTLSEFKAWFEGFSEGIDKAPTEKQFSKIKAKVAEIDGTPITYPIYVDRYITPGWSPHPWGTPWYPTWVNTNGDASAGGAITLARNTVGMTIDGSTGFDRNQFQDAPTIGEFNSLAAMNALGRAEAMN